MWLGDNQLAGEIPPEIGNLTNLGYLHLGYNELSGEMPPDIGSLTNLGYWDFTYNQLTGEVPQEVCDLIESTSLTSTYLFWGNNFTNLTMNGEGCD